MTYPLDLTKTRMQIAGELEKAKSTGLTSQSSSRAGMVRTALGVVKNEGLFHLWNGLSPALYRHVIYSGIRMALYEKIRDDIFGKNEDGTYPVHKAALTGLIVGGFAQFTGKSLLLN